MFYKNTQVLLKYEITLSEVIFSSSDSVLFSPSGPFKYNEGVYFYVHQHCIQFMADPWEHGTSIFSLGSATLISLKTSTNQSLFFL